MLLSPLPTCWPHELPQPLHMCTVQLPCTRHMCAGYIAYILFSTSAPGNPVWAVNPEELEAVWHESLNFFYVNIVLNYFGIDLIPAIPEHPVDEALFNFVNAWSLLFLPLLATDPKVKKNVRKWEWQFVGVAFLTNIFFIPLLAQRATPVRHPSGLSYRQRTASSLSPAAASQRAGAIADGQRRYTRVVTEVRSRCCRPLRFASSNAEIFKSPLWFRSMLG